MLHRLVSVLVIVLQNQVIVNRAIIFPEIMIFFLSFEFESLCMAGVCKIVTKKQRL